MGINIEMPETNVKLAALKLLRHKMLAQMASSKYPSLDAEDINEVLVVAGLPVIVPEEINSKEVKVIEVEKTKEENNGAG